MTWRGRTLHIVGLCIDPGNPTLLEGLRQNRSGRDARAQRIAQALEQIGIAGALEGAQRYATNPELVSRTHFARFLVETGVCADVIVRSFRTLAPPDGWI